MVVDIKEVRKIENLKRNMAWNAFGSLIYLASQWVITVLVTRLFGYSEAGVLSLAMSISATFQTIAMFGIRNYQVSDINNKYSDSCYIMLRNITCTVSLVLCMFFSLLNSYNIHQIAAIFWFMLFRLSEDYSDVIYGIAQRKNRLDIAGKGFALKGCLIFLAFLCGVFITENLNVCLMLMAILAWVITIFFDITVTNKIQPLIFWDKIQKVTGLGKETLPLCIYLFLSATVMVVPKYVLEKLADEAALGAYSSIFSPATIIHAAAIYIYTPFVETFAEMYNQKKIKEFISLMLKIFAALLLLTVLAVIAAILCGDYVLQIIFGDSILQYTYLLIPILTATFFIAIASFIYMLEVVIRDIKNLIIGCGVGVIGSLIFSTLLIKTMGLNGTSAGLIVGELLGIIYMLLSMFLIFRKILLLEGSENHSDRIGYNGRHG